MDKKNLVNAMYRSLNFVKQTATGVVVTDLLLMQLGGLDIQVLLENLFLFFAQSAIVCDPIVSILL